MPRRFRSLLWKTPVEREVDAELAFHLEMREREYVARGMEPAAARAAALARMGDLASTRAECRRLGRLRDRDLERAERFAELRQDLRLAARRHLAAPVFAGLSLATLALALAAATAGFAAFDALALRPLPFPAPDRLVRLREVDAQGDDLAVSRPAYLDWSAGAARTGSAVSAVTALSALLPGDRAVPLPGGVERVSGVQATASLFPLLGVHAARGRLLSSADAARGNEHRVVVLSDRLWRRLGGGWELVGQTLPLDGLPHRVVGILPAGRAFPPGVDLWTPLMLDPRRPARLAGRERHELGVVARLWSGMTPAAAAGELARASGEPGDLRAGRGDGGIQAVPLADWVVGAEARSRALLALAAAILLALLAACGVANLLISRAAGRSRELELRAALGAGRGRVLRQLATEGALLAGLGALAALPVAAAVLALLRLRFGALAEAGATGGLAASFAAARLSGLALDGRILGFFVGASLATVLAVGFVPALAASRVDLAAAARAAPPRTPRRSRRLRDALVVAEIALATVLLAGAGLTGRSFLRLRAADPGFAADRVLTAELGLAGGAYPPAARRALSRALEERLARLPGVVAVGTTSFAPWSGDRPDPPSLVTWSRAGVSDDHRDDHREGHREGGRAGDREGALAADWRSVSPGFFRALGLPLLAGRYPEDAPGLEVAVDRSLARRAWPGGGALGQRLELGTPGRPFTVVGVVGELADVAPGAPPRPTVFIPYPRRPWRTLTLVVRAAGDPELLAGDVRREIAAAVPDLPVDLRPLAHGRAAAAAGPRASLLLLALFAALALGLAATGVYDLLASRVGERTPEIAVRMALGASSRGVLLLVLRRGLALASLGAAAGLLAAARLARYLPAVLYGVSPTDAVSYLGVALLLAAVALLAGLPPARRATRIAPAAALAGR
jgi:predicted permease